jgi:hypothetical protein
MSSPYDGVVTQDWKSVTQKLIDSHPLDEKELVDVVLTSWNSIFASRFGTASFTIGKQIFPKPQIMGFLLHELIPLEIEARHSNEWKVDEDKNDKDCVCVGNNYHSFEIKTSSNPTKIFGNRSYAQASSNGRKAKDGFYLTVNFDKVDKSGKQSDIRLIRFGWLDSTDWRGQKAATGQQSNLPPEVYDGKLKIIYKL